MHMDPQQWTIREVLDLYSSDMLKVNAEYQRGEVWTRIQQRKLIDSVLRGYPLPMIYLQHIHTTIGGFTNDRFEIIDGQQRINAFYLFSQGAFQLLDPVKDEAVARFPRFLRDQPCPWAGLIFDTLSQKLQDAFLDSPLSVALLTTDEPNEVRDLFVRLQSGFPLNPQEKRDAYPGDFTDFVLKLGGKPQIARYPGHDFFPRVMRMKPGQDRGKTRQLAAQIAMLFLERRRLGADHFTDINAESIDAYYYENLDFNSNAQDCKDLLWILNKLNSLLGNNKGPKLHAHDAIHLILFVDSLSGEYTQSWESSIAEAMKRFSGALAEASASRYSDHPGEYWLSYGQHTRANSDRAQTIRRRHRFYTEKMTGFLHPLQLKDPKRVFGQLEREIIYYRDNGKCRVCNATVSWDEVEIHHVIEHAKGGETVMDNGALVHSGCHPKGLAATEFAKKWLEGALSDA